MSYTILEEIPDWAQSMVTRFVKTGVIGYAGNKFEFALNDDILRTCLILARLGLM